jgi:hypothetical protein
MAYMPLSILILSALVLYPLYPVKVSQFPNYHLHQPSRKTVIVSQAKENWGEQDRMRRQIRDPPYSMRTELQDYFDHRGILFVSGVVIGLDCWMRANAGTPDVGMGTGQWR